MSEIITVTGTVEEIIYTNSDNGYMICDVDSPDEGLFTATGYMPYILPDILSGSVSEASCFYPRNLLFHKQHPDYTDLPPGRSCCR